MSTFIAGHVTKTWLLSYELPLSENKMLHLHFKKNVEKDDVVTFTAHLNVTNKRLTRHKQKVVLAAMLDYKSMPSNMVANTNHTTLLKNWSIIKYLP